MCGYAQIQIVRIPYADFRPTTGLGALVPFSVALAIVN